MTQDTLITLDQPVQLSVEDLILYHLPALII